LQLRGGSSTLESRAATAIPFEQGATVDDPRRVTAEDYARAERFLAWNIDRSVRNHTLRHRWLDGDRLGYLRTGAGGDSELVIVDAETGTREVTADPERVGAWRAALRPGRAGDVVSPDGAWAAFVRDHDVWVRSTVDDSEFPLTTDGEEHHGYAALPGYSTRAITQRRSSRPSTPLLIWSPDSRSIATYRLDERRVADLHLLQSVPEDGSYRPRLWTYRFAMPGDEHLPMSEYVVLDVANRSTTTMAIPPFVCFAFPEIEAGAVWWSDDSSALYWISRDRHLRSAALMKGHRESGEVAEITRESTDTVVLLTSGSKNDAPDVHVLAGGDVVWYSHRDGWGHLYLLDGGTGGVRRQLTSGEWVVRGLVAVDETAGLVYFLASGREEGDGIYERRLYRVGLDGSDLRLLTPEAADHAVVMTTFDGTDDGTPPGRLAHELRGVSPSGRYLVDSYSRVDQAPVHVLRDAEGTIVAELERADASGLGAHTPIEPFRALAADGVTPVYGNIFRPSDFDPTRRYPVVDANYPGPQIIRTRSEFGAVFDRDSPQALAELGFVVVTIDGRGTPHRSRAFLDHSSDRLDLASDIEDHVAAIRQLAERDPSIDLSPGVGIYGVSGGGFRAAQAILSRPDFFTVAVSAEGNHEQRINLAGWGEVYHGPLDHAHYDLAATIPLAANLRGKLLLMHGDMDDNVHPAMTLRLVDALVKENKDFDLLILPNDNHGTACRNPYFVRRQWDYFVRNLLGAEPPAGYRIAGPAAS
jgi:dipeptidyl aminopeptidase/acylaminoacyl peptidase